LERSRSDSGRPRNHHAGYSAAAAFSRNVADGTKNRPPMAGRLKSTVGHSCRAGAIIVPQCVSSDRLPLRQEVLPTTCAMEDTEDANSVGDRFVKNQIIPDRHAAQSLSKAILRRSQLRVLRQPLSGSSNRLSSRSAAMYSQIARTSSRACRVRMMRPITVPIEHHADAVLHRASRRGPSLPRRLCQPARNQLEDRVAVARRTEVARHHAQRECRRAGYGHPRSRPAAPVELQALDAVRR